MMSLRKLHTELITHYAGFMKRLRHATAPNIDVTSDTATSKTTKERPNTKLDVPYRTSEDDPRKHSSDHLSRFYTVPEHILSSVFKNGGIPKQHKDLGHIFTETCLMVRQPFLEVKSYLENIDFSKPAVRIVLYGQHGYGKSATLSHLIHYGYNSGFLLVHLPWVNIFMRHAKDTSPSESKPGMMDVPINAAAWLVHFRSQNQHLLSSLNLKTTKTHQYGPRDTFEAGTSFEKMIEFGVGRAKYACDVAEDLLKEVKAFSNSGLFKTMVVIDGYNALFAPFIKTESRQIINAKCTFSMPFLDLTSFDWCNGVSILTVDRHAHTDPWNAESDLPLYLLGKEGWEHTDPFIPVQVDKWETAEVNSLLDYLSDRHWLQHPSAKTEEGRAELRALCAGNAKELLKICEPL